MAMGRLRVPERRGARAFLTCFVALCWVVGRASGQSVSDSIIVERDLPYATGDSLMGEFLLDVYRTRGASSAPVVISLHGGSGSKDSPHYVELSRRLAAEGMIVFNASYVSASPVAYLADGGQLLRRALEAATCAVRFASANARVRGGDEERVALLGHSAGGYFGLLAALVAEHPTTPWDRLPETRPAPPTGVACVAEEGSSLVDGFVGFNGAYFVFAFFGVPRDDPALWDAVNPASYGELRPSLATRFVLGAGDQATPPRHVEMAEAFSARRRDLGYDAGVVVVEAEHGYSFDPSPWAATLEAIRAVLGGS